MNTNLLIMDNMTSAGGTALATPPATKPIPSANTKQYAQAPDNTYPSSNNYESITTDNISNITQNESIKKPKQDFNQTLRKTVKAESLQQNQKNTKPDKQHPTSELPSKSNPAKSTSTLEIPITIGTLIQENTTKMEPKTGSQFAQLIANLKDSKSNPVIGQDVKSAETKLPIPTEKNQVGIKTVLPDKSKDQSGLKTVLPDSFSNQQKLQTSLSNISKGISITEPQPGKSKNNNAISASDGTVVTTKAPINVENTKELISDTLFNAEDNKAVANEKASILSTSVVGDSTKSPVLNGQKAQSNTLIDGSSTTKEGKNLTDESVIHTKEKTSILKANFSQVQNKITGKDSEPMEIIPDKSTPKENFSQVQNKITGEDSQPIGIVSEKSTPNANFSQAQNKITGQDSQPMEIIPEKSTPNTNITTDSKTNNPEIISESSNSNYKETTNTVNKLPNDSTARNLNIADVQISINQTKKHNSALFNNNSDSNSEQMPSQNNSVTSVAELSPNSTEGIKTIGVSAQTSLNNTSAEIGKQILESIHNSHSQEVRNQQITVQLNPPELGKVLIKFQEQENNITGLLEVSKTQTRIEIEQAIPQIVRNLQDSGIQIKRLDVVLSDTDQPEQGALKEQTLQNGWGQQQGSADSYANENNPDAGEINEWLINNKSFQNISELQESLTANDSINILI